MKHAKANIKGKSRHKARSVSTRQGGSYRVTGTWPDHSPETHYTTDKRAGRRLARQWAERGAHAILAEHAEYGTYRTLLELDGPAIVAEREAVERQAAMLAEIQRVTEARLAAEREKIRRRAIVEAARDRAQAAALMVQPPVPRTPQQRGARHTAGQR